MKKIEFKIRLLNDAEPGTGVGGELVNQRIPRDDRDRPVIPANHLKGLLREELMKMEAFPGLEGLADKCLGAPDDETPEEKPQQNEALCRLSNAALAAESDIAPTDYITRTAMDPELGKAKDGSLRTTERIAAGTVFRGKILLAGDGQSREERALTAGLLAIQAIGGGRNRGMGKVLVSIDEETAKPGDIFRKLAETPLFNREAAPSENDIEPGTKLKTLRLTFTAEEPVCCPEKPIVVGAIETGFALPPSAVRGWIVSRMAKEYGEDLAGKLYESDKFRAWPLLPCGCPNDRTEEKSDAKKSSPEIFYSTRVSVTHKTAKLVLEGKPLQAAEVEDKPILEVMETPSNNPLKASDGVLLVSEDGKIKLWKSGSMPRVASAHGVHNDRETEDGRNLYQTVSMAPLVWSGIVTLPEKWADLLIDSVKNDDYVSLGRFRSTHGLGRMTIAECSDDAAGLPWSKSDYDDILILQSPILLDAEGSSDDARKTANGELEAFVKRHWSALFQNTDLDVRAISTNIGVRFGWNRTVLKERTGKGGRQKACRVALPGSVFRIHRSGISEMECREEKEHRQFRKTLHEKGLDQTLRVLIQSGLGEGVERGFGDVSVHPGMAGEIFRPQTEKDVPARQSKGRKEIVQAILDLWQKNRQNLPSPSQISAVAGKAAKDRLDAVLYLQGQLERTEGIWATWKNIKIDIESILKDENKYDSAAVQAGLKLLTDLVKYNQKA